MAFIQKIITGLQNYSEELHRDRYPYLRPDQQLFGLKWAIQQGGYGCRPIPGQATIQMVKSPPPIPGAPPPPPTPPSPPQPSPSAAPSKGVGSPLKAGEGQQRSSNASAQQCPTLPQFDMLDLPAAMATVGFKHAAYCADRWFKGAAHTIAEKSRAIQPNEYVDKSTFKLSWILGVGNVQAKFDHLIDSSLASDPDIPANIYNTRSRNRLEKIFSSHAAEHGTSCRGPLDALAHCGGDVQILHRDFQFQRCPVSMVDVLGGYFEAIPNDLIGKEVMNDLAASLANFNFYAAVAHATFNTTTRMHYDNAPWLISYNTEIAVTDIYVYARDVYSFNDDRSDSQYLGHWNRYGVVVAYDAAAAQVISKFLFEKISQRLTFELGNDPRPFWPQPSETLSRAIDTGRSFADKQVFYAVRNRDFQNWRGLKNRGGDFVIFTDLRKIKLPVPMIIKLPPVFKEYLRYGKNW